MSRKKQKGQDLLFPVKKTVEPQNWPTAVKGDQASYHEPISL